MADEERAEARVLVVDDNRLTRELTAEILRESCRVECCDGGEAALAALEREPAELVVSDLTMPGLSGVDLLERVRREHPGTDFVLLTANASVESAVSALRMGAADYLFKPVRPEEISLVVDRILARRRLLEENKRLRDALSTMDSCRTLMRCLDAGGVYAVALDLLLHTLGRSRGFALFRRGNLPASDGVALRGFDEAQARALRAALIDEKLFEIDSIERIEVISDGALHRALGEIGIEQERVLVMPVRGRETEAGTLFLPQDGRPFASSEIERAKLIAGHAELALYNAERYNHAKERAFIDDVTEVYNARYLLQAIEQEISRADRYRKQFCLAFLDLDRFKLVNDHHGHLVGSQVLRRLSEVLQQCIRQVDTLARYGGDEFTILLADSQLEAGLAVAERIRQTVAETLFEGARNSPIRLTISIGVATYPDHSQDRDTLLDMADKAMYRAKSLGRNCVCSASELPS